MILAQILFACAFLLHTTKWELSDVNSEADVVALHDYMSSDTFRYQTEVAAGCLWLSFPLLLCAIYVLQVMANEVARGTSGELLIYVMEKSALVFMVVVYIILPAVSLVVVSLDWSFNEAYVAGESAVPTGYYIQFYAVMLQYELIDCAAIADFTFLGSLFLAVRVMLYGSNRNNKKFVQFRQMAEPFCCKNRYLVFAELASCCCLVALTVIFCVILFEFAEDGFFSPTGRAKFLFFAVMAIKVGIGARMVSYSRHATYAKIKKLLDSFVLKDEELTKVGGHRNSNSEANQIR